MKIYEIKYKKDYKDSGVIVGVFAIGENHFSFVYNAAEAEKYDPAADTKFLNMYLADLKEDLYRTKHIEEINDVLRFYVNCLTFEEVE